MTTPVFGRAHGSMMELHDGREIYLQYGKQSHQIPPGIREGEYLVRLFEEIEYQMLTAFPDLDDYYLFNHPEETKPGTRRKVVNMLNSEIDDDLIYIEPHVNAAWLRSGKWDERKRPAEGHRVFYNTKAKHLAKDFSAAIHANKTTNTIERRPLPAPWPWIQRMNCPALLCEDFFMTNLQETLRAQTAEGVAGFARGKVEFLKGVIGQ